MENFGVEKLVEFSVLNFAAEGGCCLASSGRTCLYQGRLQRILIANTCHYHLLLRFFEVEDGVRNCAFVLCRENITNMYVNQLKTGKLTKICTTVPA